jgi:FtsP/CotA-like multicopper oxidase with cupredoxin domain
MAQRSFAIGRREFIQYGLCGLSAVAAGSLRFSPVLRSTAHAADLAVNLSMEEAVVEMIDRRPVFHWVFAGPNGPSFPGPVIFAATGDNITINVTNNLDEVHEFRIIAAGSDRTHIESGPIRPGETTVVTFVAPDGGTYMYLDPRNAPVNRVLGLHGAFVVLPAGVQEGAAVSTPYTNPTAQVQRLFNDLGSAEEFPGDPWIPIRPAGTAPNDHLPADIEPFLFRTRIWFFTHVDPALNAIAEQGGNAEPGGGIDPGTVVRDFLPRYFLINGQSGAFASNAETAPDVVPEGFIGEPHVVRILNAGLATESLHLHANHFYVLAVNNVVQESVFQPDSMTLRTVEGDAAGLPDGISASGRSFLFSGSRLDWLIPFKRPPDIPGDRNTPLRDLLPTELALVLGDVPQSPLEYPMHDHMEPSQTAAGGNYPQGAVTHITFLGDLDKVPFPVGSAELSEQRRLRRGITRSRRQPAR